MPGETIQEDVHDDDYQSDDTTWALVKDIRNVRAPRIIILTIGPELASFQECIRSGHPVEDELVCFTMKYVYQNPSNGFRQGAPLNRHDVRRLVETCVDTLMHDNGPVLSTMRMQVRNHRPFFPTKGALHT